MVVIVSAAATTIAPKSNLWTMATVSFTPPPSSSLSSLSSSLPPSSHRPILSCFLCPSHSLSKSHSSRPFSSSSSLIWYTLPNKSRPTSFSTLALVDQQEPLVDEQEPFAAADPIGDDDSRDDGSVPDNNTLLKPCELDVCNLPRSFGTTELEDLFKPYGTVQSVEVVRPSLRIFHTLRLLAIHFTVQNATCLAIYRYLIKLVFRRHVVFCVFRKMTDCTFGTGPQNESMEGYVEMGHGEELESGKASQPTKIHKKKDWECEGRVGIESGSRGSCNPSD